MSKDKPVDLLILSVSYEFRCLDILRNTDTLSTPRNILIINFRGPFWNVREFNRTQLHSIANQRLGIQPAELACDKFDLLDGLLSVHDFVKSLDAVNQVDIDVSTLTTPYALLLLRYFSTVWPQCSVRTFYSNVRQTIVGPLEASIGDLITVPYFGGVECASNRRLFLAVLGMQTERAWYAWNALNPHLTVTIFGDEESSKTSENKQFIRSACGGRVEKASETDPLAITRTIDEYYRAPEYKDWHILIGLFSNKTQVLGTYLFFSRNASARSCRIVYVPSVLLRYLEPTQANLPEMWETLISSPEYATTWDALPL